MGSSPHTRGAPTGPSTAKPRTGIIPAYAGSTLRIISHLHTAADHPRIRGEHNPIKPPIGDGMGSSPHTRGALVDVVGWAASGGIIPAYAGSTVLPIGSAGSTRDHPRIRGEHIQKQSADSTGKGSSPHTRGAQARCLSPGCRIRIIPAYAGSTRKWRRVRVVDRDHPRIRGEHCRSTL